MKTMHTRDTLFIVVKYIGYALGRDDVIDFFVFLQWLLVSDKHLLYNIK